MGDKTKKPMKKLRNAFLAGTLALGTVLLLCPGFAFADGILHGGMGAMIEMAKTLVTWLFLPLGVIIAASKLIYIAIVCGLLGMDPLNIVQDADTGLTGTGISHAQVSAALKTHLYGFAKGLAWVAGLFVIFRVALGVAGMLADSVEGAFGTGGDTEGNASTIESSVDCASKRVSQNLANQLSNRGGVDVPYE